jgi:hypothetical protein
MPPERPPSKDRTADAKKSCRLPLESMGACFLSLTGGSLINSRRGGRGREIEKHRVGPSLWRCTAGSRRGTAPCHGVVPWCDTASGAVPCRGAALRCRPLRRGTRVSFLITMIVIDAEVGVVRPASGHVSLPVGRSESICVSALSFPGARKTGTSYGKNPTAALCHAIQSPPLMGFT